MKTLVGVASPEDAFVEACLNAGLTQEQAETAMLVVMDQPDVVREMLEAS